MTTLVHSEMTTSAVMNLTAALRVHAGRGDSPRMLGTLENLDSARRELARLESAPI